MFSHVTVGVNSLERAVAFYEPLMVELGLVCRFREAHWAGWMEPGVDRPLFMINRPLDGNRSTPGNGQMVAFVADTRDSVDRFYELAVQQGGTCEGPPGVRPQYHANYYGAYVRDPDGNKLCVCCHKPLIRATNEGTG